MERKLISVIVPAYNAEKYLAEALTSIFEQDYQPHEVIVVDDGSTDRTAAVAKSFREIRYLHQPNQGNAAARNKGIAQATGDFISFLDADDMWVPSKSRVEMQYLSDHSEQGCVMARIQNFLQAGMTQPDWATADMFGRDFKGYLLGTLLAHRWVFDKIGNFNTAYKLSCETEWFVRLSESDVILGTLPDVLLRRRVHDSNLSANHVSAVHNRLLILKRSIDRKRAQAALALSSQCHE